jgi:hypothetical protein
MENQIEFVEKSSANKPSVKADCMTNSELVALAEVFLILEKWQSELELKLQKENRHSGQHHNPIESHPQDSPKLF